MTDGCFCAETIVNGAKNNASAADIWLDNSASIGHNEARSSVEGKSVPVTPKVREVVAHVREELASRPWDPEADSFGRLLGALQQRQGDLERHIELQHSSLKEAILSHMNRFCEELKSKADAKRVNYMQTDVEQLVPTGHSETLGKKPSDSEVNSFMLLFRTMQQQELALQKHIEIQHACLRRDLEARLHHFGHEWEAAQHGYCGVWQDKTCIAHKGTPDTNPNARPSGGHVYAVDAASEATGTGRERVVAPSRRTPRSEHSTKSNTIERGLSIADELELRRAETQLCNKGATMLDLDAFETESNESPGCGRRIKWFIKSPYFDLISGVLVVLNTAMMFLDLEKDGMECSVALNLSSDIGIWKDLGEAFGTFEHIFNALFIIELFMRIWAVRMQFFRDYTSIADMAIVFATSVDAYLLPFILDSSGGGTNFGFARMARLLRVVRVLRAFRAAAVFSELRVLLKTLISSVMALIWSVILLTIIIVASGILLTQLLHGYIMDSSQNYGMRMWVYKHYGSASRASYTVFEATLSGGWPKYARPLIESVSEWYAVFWLLYVICVVFATTRVITALFLRATMVSASNDEEMMVLRKMKEKEKLVAKLRHFFNEADSSDDGMVDRSEFDLMLEDKRMQAWLHVLELEIYEVTALFELLDDGTGEISCEEFIGGVMRLKGNARAIDSITIMHEQHKIKQGISRANDGLKFLWQHLNLDSEQNPWRRQEDIEKIPFLQTISSEKCVKKESSCKVNLFTGAS